MKKLLVLSILFFTGVSSAFAEGAMTISVPDAVNSRIFSTQGARPLDDLERTRYTNEALMQMEAKNNPQTKNEQPVNNKTEDSEEKDKGGFFKGFRVIW